MLNKNGQILLVFDVEIIRCLRTAPNNEKGQQMLKIMEDDRVWSRVQLEIGVNVLCWLKLLAPLYSVCSKSITVAEAKVECETIQDKINGALEDSSAFAGLRAFARAENLSELSEKAISKLDKLWVAADSRCC